MSRLRSLLEIALIEFHHRRRRLVRRHGGSLQDLVIERNRKFSLVEVGTKKNMKARSSDDRLGGGGAFERLGGETGLREDKAATQLQVLIGRKVQHAGDSGRAAAMHPGHADEAACLGPLGAGPAGDSRACRARRHATTIASDLSGKRAT